MSTYESALISILALTRSWKRMDSCVRGDAEDPSDAVASP
jgi:hypothetical protein